MGMSIADVVDALLLRSHRAAAAEQHSGQHSRQGHHHPCHPQRQASSSRELGSSARARGATAGVGTAVAEQLRQSFRSLRNFNFGPHTHAHARVHIQPATAIVPVTATATATAATATAATATAEAATAEAAT